MITTTCMGTRLYPGCGATFEAPSLRKKFCPACSKLCRSSSFVFVERRGPQAHVEEEE